MGIDVKMMNELLLLLLLPVHRLKYTALMDDGGREGLLGHIVHQHAALGPN